MNWVRCAFAIALVSLVAGLPLRAQPPDPAALRGDSTQTRKRLSEAEQKLLAGKSADAIDDLQRVLDEAADDLITVDGKQYRPARWIAHQILARLPADALKGYQDRLEVPARKLLDAAKKTRDPAPLRQLLDRYFVSRPADEALLLLGDLLFERGELRAAELQWRRLLPSGGVDVAYPGSKADPAAVQARIILATIFQGDTDLAATELAAFKVKYPDARGKLAGKDGLLAEMLQSYLDAAPRLPPAANPGGHWPTFGASPQRSAVVGQRIPMYWPARPTWEKPLRNDRFSSPGWQPFGNPVIVNGRVFVTDGLRVLGFDLVAGKPIVDYRLSIPPGIDPGNPGVASPSLTAARDRLYVRLGSPVIRTPDATKFGKPGEDTAIACLIQTVKVDGSPTLKELWRVRPPAGDGKAPIVWEGAPLVAERRMWAAYSRFEGGRIVHGIACYDPADQLESPDRPAWVADVSDSPMSLGTEGRARHELLTLVGRNVVFSSNDGAVIALDAATGRRAWGFRYPRSKKADTSRTADPNPAVAAAGRVFVAPVDAERVYALDAETGQLLWESGPTEGAQILGVAAGKVIVTVAGPVRGIRGLNVATGSYRYPDGWIQHDGGGYLSFGRGFVTDDAIIWPTRNGLYFLRTEDGSRIWTPHATGTPFGNVVYADGVLVVVSPTQVWGYVSDRKRFGEPRSDRDPIREKFEVLIETAERALVAGDRDTARQSLLVAAHKEFPKPLRAWAVARLLLLTPKADEGAQRPADLSAAIAAELLGEWLIPPDGIPITLQTLLDRHLGHEAPPRFWPTSPVAMETKPEPSLTAETAIERTFRVPGGAAPLRWLPGMAAPRRVFLTTAEQVIAVPLDGGAESRHDAAERFTHAADIPDGFVVAGPWAVTVYGVGRAPVWVFRVPRTAPLPAKPGEFCVYSDQVPSVAELSSFRLAGAWLVARLGQRHLIALDLRGKRVAWVLGAGGTIGYRPAGFADAPRFGPEFFATGRLIVVQLSDGRRWFLRTETGKRLDMPDLDQPTAKVWWALPPAEVEANRLAISDGPGLVRMLNLATGRVKWTHHEDGLASLTGQPPQVRAWNDVILIAVSRNHGVELDRLDMSDGTTLWKSGPAFVDATRVNLAHADADTEHIFMQAGDRLVAFTLKTGRTEWEAELPATHGAGGWVVKAGSKCVVAYPEAAIPRERVADVLARVLRGFRTAPAPWRLPGLAAGLYDAWVTRTVPVLLIDPETGKQLARIDIPAAGPAVTAWFDRDTAVVATGNRVVWLR